MSDGLYYLDTSALVKLVRREPETPSLVLFMQAAEWVSSELTLVELPRALRCAAAGDSSLPLPEWLEQANDVLAAIALVPVTTALLQAAGAVPEPRLRSLDAVHVASALEITAIAPLDGFISYDLRQAAAARLCGLQTFAPGTDGPLPGIP